MTGASTAQQATTACATPGPNKSASEPPLRRSLVLVYLGYALRYLYLMVLIPFYGHVLGPSAYGRLLSGMTVFQTVWTLTDFGFGFAGMRDTAAAASPEARAGVYGRHLAGRLATTMVGVPVGLAAVLFSPVLRDDLPLGLAAVLNGVVASLNLGWYFQATLRFTRAVAVEILGFALNLSAILVLVRKPEDAWMVMTSLLGSSIVCTAVAHVLVLRELPLQAVKLRGGLRLIRECAPLFAHRGATVIAGGSTTYMLGLFAPQTAVGWYGAAERVINVAQGLFAPAGQVLVGTIANHLGEKGGEARANYLARRSAAAMVGFGVVMLLGAEVLAGTVLPLLLGASFEPSVALFRVLALIFPFAAFSQVAIDFVLLPRQRDRLVSAYSSAMAVLMLLMCMGAAYLWGALGVAVVRVLAAIVGAAALIGLLRSQRLLAQLWPGKRAVTNLAPTESAVQA
jgi:O-antigen/teichoic acid export membrane protein